MRRLASFATSLVQRRMGRRGLPRFMTYIVTFTCNARCIMCDSWKKESPDDLSLAEVESIFRQLPPMDALRLTGGEPFVRKDLPEIAQLAVDHLQPWFLHVTSNGFLTSRIVEFCETRDRSTPLRLMVSLDGMAEKHNHVRGRDTAWDSATATLKALAPRQKELNLTLSVNQTVVDAGGAEHYRKLRDFLKPLNVRHQMVLAYDASATYSLKLEQKIADDQIGKFATFGDFDTDQLGALLDEAEDDASALPFGDRLARNYYLRGARERVVHGNHSGGPACVALDAHLRLFPNGDVPVCQFNSHRVGNLRRQDFREVWFGEEARKERDWVKNCPGCWAECEVLPNAIYSGNLLKSAVLGH